MRSYKDHIQELNSRPSEKSLTKPVHRASAIFPALNQTHLKTRLLFLGYWKIKRNLPLIGALVSLRAAHGELIARSNFNIESAQAFRIELASLLTEAGLSQGEDFFGSIEIEFFSATNIVFPFPAVVVNYYGPGFSSMVHTAQRVYNDAEDAGKNSENVVPEAGFNIYGTPNTRPFFSLINGPESVSNPSIEIAVTNQAAETLSKTLKAGTIRPYESRIYFLNEIFELEDFLDGSPGSVKTTFSLNGVFPRVICGNFQNEPTGVSITHSFYDCCDAKSESDYWPLPDEGWHAANINCPIFPDNSRSTNVFLYNIYSPSELAFDVEVYTEDGVLLGTLSDAATVKSPASGYSVISLEGVCGKLGIEQNAPLAGKIVAKPVNGSKLPSRLKVALDVGVNASALPTNICTAFTLHDKDLQKKPRAFHWAPFLPDAFESAIWLHNSSPEKNYQRAAAVELNFYRELDTDTLKRKIILSPNGSQLFPLSQDPELVDFLDGLPGWVVMIADNPHVDFYYFVEGENGIVGGDHSF